MMKNEKFMRCSECGNTELIHDFKVGEIVCDRCGFVVSSAPFNTGPERKAYDEEQWENRTRTGGPVTWAIHDKGLSTEIDWRNQDYHGRRLSPEQQNQMHRMRKWNRMSKVSDTTDKNLAFALSELTKASYKLNLPKNVLETASIIYRRMVYNRLIKGRSIEGVVTASLYMACRQCNVVRTLEEVGTVFNVSKTEGGRNYRILLRKLNIKIHPFKSKLFVSKLVNQLELSGNIESIAIKIMDQAYEKKLVSGRGPSGIAAAATYIACLLLNQRQTQGAISKSAQITEVTIRNRYKELIRELNIQIEL